jgi:hypothetical protein
MLQHVHNPVDWYPWGDEQFDKAKQENKPVFVKDEDSLLKVYFNNMNFSPVSCKLKSIKYLVIYN